MIQVYRQETIRESLPKEKWYVSNDTFWGIKFKIESNDLGVRVSLTGTSSVSDETFINLTWPFQKKDIPDFIYMKTSRKSDDILYFGISCVDSGGDTMNQYFGNGESTHSFDLPYDAKDIRAVAYVKGKKSVDTTIDVELYLCERPLELKKVPGSNGDMTLFPTEAYVHAILNGSWEAHLEHPIDLEGRWKYLVEDNVIKMPSFNGDQLFRIKSKEKRDSGIACDMEPIFYDAIGDCWLEDIRPTKKNGQQALNMMLSSENKYSARSDITKVSTAYYQYKNFLEALNGDNENSFINRWGGEILFDNFQVIVNERVGGDYGVELRYGKNIPEDGLIEEIDTRGVVTRIYPKAYNGHTMTIPEFGSRSDLYGYVDSPLIGNYPTVRTAALTFDDVKMAEDAQEGDADNGVIICRNQDELNEALEKRCMEQFEAGLDKPQVTIEADMVLLQNTELYKDYKVLEEVGFGDTIHCRHSRLDITTDARVIELKYNSIKKCVESVVLGDFQYNFFDNVSSAVDRIDGAIRPDGSVIAEKIAGFIDGAMASLRAQYNVAEKQDVLAILFENLDEESPLYGAMALGTQGLIISKQRTEDGRGWDWTTALTANGLVAGIIVAGILSDRTGKSWWDLDKGEIHLEGGYFSGTIYAKDGVFSGEIRSSKGKIGGWTITANGLSNGNVHIYSTKYTDDDEDFSDGSPETVIYLDGIKTGTVHAAEVYGYIHDLWAYTGEIPIVTKIEKTGDGGLRWTHSTIKVEDGIIKNAPRSEVVYDGR